MDESTCCLANQSVDELILLLQDEDEDDDGGSLGYCYKVMRMRMDNSVLMWVKERRTKPNG